PRRDRPPGGAPPPREPPAEEPEPAPRRRRRSLVAVVALLALLGGAVWGGMQVVARREAGDEADRLQRALKEDQERNYAEAAEQVRKLTIDLPKSPDEAKDRLQSQPPAGP